MSEAVLYRVGPDDTILEVGGAFERFARENGAPALAQEAPGRRLWDYVLGDEVTHLWEVLLADARAGSPAVVPYRCDADDKVRRMRMRLDPAGDGSVVFTSFIDEEAPRAPVPLFAVASIRHGNLLASCSWCRRFDVDGWVEAEEAVERLGILSDVPPPPITHTICDDCRQQVLAGHR
ncbi:MAG: hypothetical protein JO073_05565 [Actinobacteria bacterium]|nr:hypothetical protein [Actinomycetota bacterium]